MIYKRKHYNIGYILFLFSCVLFVTSCKKSRLIDEFYLGDLIYSNPYQGTETLIYSSSDGSELSFQCLGRSRSTIESAAGINTNDYYITERDVCSFIDSTNDFSIDIGMETSRYSQPKLGIGLSNYILNKGGEFVAKSRFNLPLDKNNLLKGQEYFDSIAINGKYYYHVFSDKCELYFPFGNSSDTTQYLSILYYNTAQGLVKLSFSKGMTWELKEIIQ